MPDDKSDIGQFLLCPECKSVEHIPIFRTRLAEILGSGQKALVIEQSQSIKCAHCGAIRHCSQWKTPKEHEEREKSVSDQLLHATTKGVQ